MNLMPFDQGAAHHPWGARESLKDNDEMDETQEHLGHVLWSCAHGVWDTRPSSAPIVSCCCSCHCRLNPYLGSYGICLPLLCW